MKRARARELVEELLRNVVAGGWPAELVRTVYVFGSYARGGLDPQDVDIAVDIERGDPRWARHVAASLSAGRDTYALLRQALRGRRRSISIVFDHDGGADDTPMQLLWQRGDSLDVALGRLDTTGEAVDTGGGTGGWTESQGRAA